MYYPSSENKGADQLRSNCEADLRLCFRIGNSPVFSQRGSSSVTHFSIYLFDLCHYVPVNSYGHVWMLPLIHGTVTKHNAMLSKICFNQRTNGPVNAHLRSASYTNKHI